MGVHSLRAVEPIEIKVLADSNIRKIPFHMHVSEQAKEVIDAFNYLGKRPVEWILENIALDKHFHLVHATHLSKAEVSDLALSQANVVLCPSTEGNLGDGFFSLKAFQELGGNWSIGTDSHIGLNPLEELRLLDYGQRLKSYFRHTFPTQEESDPAISALKSTTLTGRRAMGNFSERFFAVGDKFNACIIRSDTPLISTTSTAQLASTILYSNEAKVLATIVNGKIKSYNGQVENQKGFQYRFAKVIADLKNR